MRLTNIAWLEGIDGKSLRLLHCELRVNALVPLSAKIVRSFHSMTRLRDYSFIISVRYLYRSGRIKRKIACANATVIQRRVRGMITRRELYKQIWAKSILMQAWRR